MASRLRVITLGFALLSLIPFPVKQALAGDPNTASSSWTSAFFPTGAGFIAESSPIMADIDGDGKQEILVGTTGEWYSGGAKHFGASTRLIVMRPDGSIKWSVDVGAPMRSSPAVGDINGDGQKEIVVSVGADADFANGDIRHNGGIIAYDSQGMQLWRFNTQDYFPKNGYSDGVFSSPLLCDLDNDNKMEIAFGAWDQRIYLLDSNGQSLWSNLPNGWPGPGYMNADTIWSSAACADLTGDGHKEVIIGADISGGGVLPDGTRPQDGGYVYVFNKAGRVLVRRYLPETVYSSPAVADINRDGQPEIVVGTGRYWWETHGRREQPYVYAFDTHRVASDLSYADPAKLPDLPGWPQPTVYPGFSSPALADLNHDGYLEIVIGAGLPGNNPVVNACGNSAADPDCYGAIYAWTYTSAPVSGFPMWPKDYMGKNNFIDSSPVVADVDGDGHLEILFAMLWDVIVVGENGIEKNTLHTTWTVSASPLVGDTDQDGWQEVWIGGGKYEDQGQGYMWRFKGNGTSSGQAPWPMFHRDAQHSGSVTQPGRLGVSPSSLYFLHPAQHAPGLDQQSTSLVLSNTGGQAFTWSATAVADTSIAPSSGTLAPQQSTTVKVTVSTKDRVVGTYALGDLHFTATASESRVESSPAQIPVTLRVLDLPYRIFLPVARR